MDLQYNLAASQRYKLKTSVVGLRGRIRDSYLFQVQRILNYFRLCFPPVKVIIYSLTQVNKGTADVAHENQFFSKFLRMEKCRAVVTAPCNSGCVKQFQIELQEQEWWYCPEA